MQTETRYKLTKILLYASIVGALASPFLSKTTFKEPYPFFHWALYSKPSGYKNVVEDYRVYTFSENEKKYERQPIKTTISFDAGDYGYMFNDLIQPLIMKNASKWDEKKLQIFLNYLYPQCYKFKIIQETYIPLKIIKNATQYDTATIYSYIRK